MAGLQRRRFSDIEITAEMVNLFKRAMELQPTYEACVANDVCEGDGTGHCPRCNEFLEVEHKLRGLVGMMNPFDTLPTYAELDEPVPDYIIEQDATADWHRSVRLRKALLKAAKLK